MIGVWKARRPVETELEAFCYDVSCCALYAFLIIQAGLKIQARFAKYGPVQKKHKMWRHPSDRLTITLAAPITIIFMTRALLSFDIAAIMRP